MAPCVAGLWESVQLNYRRPFASLCVVMSNPIGTDRVMADFVHDVPHSKLRPVFCRPVKPSCSLKPLAVSASQSEYQPVTTFMVPPFGQHGLHKCVVWRAFPALAEFVVPNA